jgi:hypothetical protein
MIAITDEQVLELVRAEIAAAVERERPLVRQEIVESFKYVTEETGVKLIEIEGKDPLRTFRRLMNTYGVETLKLQGIVRYRWKRRTEPPSREATARHGISIEELIEKHVVPSRSKKPQLRAVA